MLSQPINNETPQLPGAVPVYGLNELIASAFESDSAEAAISILQELARSQDLETRPSREVRAHQRPYESGPPLQKLPPSEWRSLGGYFDYSLWTDRERFMELDRAIVASQRTQLFELETSPDIF